MKNKKGFGSLVKRELFRAVLERTQSIDLDTVTPPMMKQNKVSYDDVEENLNITYLNREETPLAMDVFRKKGSEDKESPVIVLIHGGGLYMGDRRISRPLGRWLAHRGYLIFSIEYRLAPKVNVSQEFDDVCAGLDIVGQKLVDYNVDFSRVYLMAESAGAYLATYVTAMHDSPKLQKAIGHKPSRFVFKAVGLTSGMYYTEQQGQSFAEQLYGSKSDDKVFRKYMNPENPEIINNLPPVFLMTSRGDFLNNATFKMHEALKKAGKTCHLLYCGDENLTHAFSVLQINNPNCEKALNKMLAWFEEQSLLDIEKSKNKKTVKIPEIDSNQKIWKYICEKNSVSEERKKHVAVIDCTREYTYEQVFNEWTRYAKVFSGLGICSNNKSKVAIMGSVSAEPLFAFYGLNMTGAEVSMFSYADLLNPEEWKKNIKKEKITDLILSDIAVTPKLWKEIESEKKNLGLQNVLLLHSRLGGPCAGPVELTQNEFNYHSLKRISGTLFIDDLFSEYEDNDISYGKYDEKKIALTTHDADISEFTDKDINEYKCSEKTDTHKTVLVMSDFSSSSSFREETNYALCNGNTVVLTFFGFVHPKFINAIDYYGVTNVSVTGFMLDRWIERTDLEDTDLSSLENVIIAGEKVSSTDMEKYTEFFKNHGFEGNLSEEKSSNVKKSVSDIFESLNDYPVTHKKQKKRPSIKEIMDAVNENEEISEIVGEYADKITAKMMKLSGKPSGMKDFDYDIEE